MEILGIIILIILLITLLIIFIISIYNIIREYKEFKTFNERILFWIFITILSFPTIIFYIDYFNIPSMLGWTNTMDSNTWLESIIGYVVTIIAAIIGAFVTICSVKMTIEDQEKVRSEENKKKALPLLKISAEKNCENINKSINVVFTFDKKNKEKDIRLTEDTKRLTIKLKNVGMRELYDLHVGEFTSQYFSVENAYNYMYPIIYKDDSECIDLIFFELEKYENEDVHRPIVSPIMFSCYFKDCYNNWYHQEFKISVLHQLSKDIEEYRLALKVFIDDTSVISAPMEISKENLPWNNQEKLVYHL